MERKLSLKRKWTSEGNLEENEDKGRKSDMGYLEKLFLNGDVCVITGGAGLLGRRHAEAVLEGKGIPVLLDVSSSALIAAKEKLTREYPQAEIETFEVDITNKASLRLIGKVLLEKYGHIDVLINNAANNPKVEGGAKNLGATRFTEFPAEKQKRGVILNIGSDYGIIAPDQRVYRKDRTPEEEQIIKPVSYSVVKHGLIGLTKYLAAYWGDKGIRVNTLCPASLYNGQDTEFVNKLSQLIPMRRMSRPEEYVFPILYMISEASSYMTGATVVLDGGRTII